MTGGSLSYNLGTTGGGGAYVNGTTSTVEITGGTISHNSSTNGGGIYANQGSVTIKSASVIENSATGMGGGIYATSDNTTVIIDKNSSSAANARFTNNSANSGGGIYAQAQNVTVANADFVNNRATNGGGIYVKGPVTLDSGTSLTQNKADRNGGAVYVADGIFTMKSGVIVGGGSIANANQSLSSSGNYGGGGIYVTGTTSKVDIQGGEISYNTAANYGGGLYVASTGQDGTKFSGTTVLSNNQAVLGGGAYIGGGKLNLSGQNVSVNNNTANDNGGGIYMNNGNVEVSYAKIQNNTATAQSGGGLYVGNGEITLSGAVISGNHADNATNGKGGGIFAGAGTIHVNNNAQIGTDGAKAGNGNTATYGGGLYVNSGEMTFSDGVFGGNFASEQGGGIYIKEGATLDLQGTAKLTQNYVPADKKGGGVYMDGILKVGGGTSPSMLCEDNYAGTTSKLNNVYLPSYNKVVTLQSDIHSNANTHIGISVEQGFKPVVQSDTEPWLYNLMPNSGIMTGQLFDDAGKYIAIHTREDDGTYEKQYIYFIGCWTTQVDTDPQAHLTDYPLPTGVGQHYEITSDGTYHIYTKEGLAWYSSLVNGLNDQTANPGLNAVLENDVDMDGYFWVPLGSVSGYNTSNSAFTEEGTGYTGTFNGQGHIITNLGCGYLTGIYKYGLFGAVNNGTVKNTFVDDYTFNLTSSTGKYKTGGIAGVIAGTACVSNCVARGTTIDNANSASQYLRSGGLIGEMDELTAPKVHSCMAMPEFVINNSKNYNIGGLVGVNYQGTLENSYCNMKRTNNTTLSTNEQDLRLGILAGYNSGTIANCYARLQEGTAALTTNEGWFVGYNASSGKIYYCYAPTDTPYVGRDESNGAGLIGHGTYGETSLLNGKYGFEQQDQQVSASNDYVENGAIDNTGELKGLLATLNNWVEAQTDGVAYSNWTRTMASPINDDYPILEFNDFVCAGSTDNVFVSYKDNLGDMISEVNGNTNGGSIYLYGSNPVAVGASTNNNVRVYIPEHIGVKQAGNNTINARVGVTFDNSAEDFMAYDWHMFSTPLTAAPLGITYNHTTPYGAGEVIEASGITLTSQGYFPANTGFNNFDFYCYSEKDYHWINFKRNSNDHWHQDAPYSNISYTNETNLVQGKGYMMAVNQPTMLMADGTLTNADVEIGVTYTSDALDFKGANLIGNPYQSYLDFEEVANVNDGNNGKPNINIYYILDADQKGYLAYTADASTQPEVEGTEGVASRYIHPHQGFFVKVDGNARAKFTSDMRKTLAEVEADDETSNFRGARIAYPLVNLKCTDSEGRNDFSTVEVNRPEQGGGEKALGLHTGNASIWAHVGDTDYHTAFTTEGTTMVPVRFKAYDDDTFTLSWNTQNGEFSYLHLIDNMTGMDIDCLATDKYVFEGKTDDYTSRFKLVFGQANEDEEVDGSMIGSTFAFIMGDELVVNGEGLLQVFDMNGRQLVSTQLHGTQSTVSLPAVANGVYLMHLTNDNQVKTQKMVINK